MAQAALHRAVRIEEALTAANLAKRLRSYFQGQGVLRGVENGVARIGICVSGGPDSMALASLLGQAAKVPDLPGIRPLRLEPQAFIVNHNARENSREEAGSVKAELEGLGMKTTVLEMQWPDTDKPNELSNFEGQARKERYRLLARAALAARIRHLFLGHHQDDQIETIFSRLWRQRVNFLSLRGMDEHTTIPCCGDIKAAQTTDGHETFEDWLAQRDAPPREQDAGPGASNVRKTVSPSRPLPIQIHRPLLDVPKADLVDFCTSNNIAYVNDATNFDPTLTPRNAIRYLRSNYRLPRALEKDSMLGLHKWANKCTASLSQRGTKLLEMIKVRYFDLVSGRMAITAPEEFLAACEADQEAGAYALARLTSVIMPKPKDQEHSCVSQTNVKQFLEKARSTDPVRMLCQQVLLERNPSGSTKRRFLRDYIWELARPPMRGQELDRETAFSSSAVVQAAASGVYRPVGTSAADAAASSPWSDWVFWDNRFWIRVRPEKADSLPNIRVRTYREDDLKWVYEHVKYPLESFKEVLAETTPGNLRYTLPVLTVHGMIAAFPTLNVGIRLPPSLQKAILEWEVCYKVLDQPFINDHRKKIDWRNAQPF